ncbi:dienelactone hydrolase family protein [Ramlibacter tataouinensis]|uniref:KANL3/Tex30 alpha/beta hydrolase-like domain-containing protein n=1 Tax=Ramlibacter tataouinensis (strain ATCC BAA-407 / DSM 14655 / LMG 21543 / TTB310) TaxID=365046 RepID=F5XYG1_RAMTT|nr:alpha/beta family hydrolase [Ramlibacter tataouinensis]AEG93137.1 hypothetical protein Rta_20440 [Ramlibacter tataouinensis TTB310]
MPTKVFTREVRIPAGDAWLQGDLVLPEEPLGLVLFAHGSGSGRHSGRNRRVAAQLQQQGIATLLPDLLTAQEQQDDSRTRQHRFDIPLLTGRLQDAAAWAAEQPVLTDLPLGLFGASTGSAAALIATARLRRRVTALVSRGGRADLAGPAVLAAIVAPTLLIVGGRDAETLALNQAAYEHLRCERSLAVVPGAGHLFEEPGALERVADLAAGWFQTRFAAAALEVAG